MPLPKGVVALGEPSQNASAVFRRESSKDGFPTLPGITTLYELFTKSVEKYGDLPAIGSRPIKVRSRVLAPRRFDAKRAARCVLRCAAMRDCLRVHSPPPRQAAPLFLPPTQISSPLSCTTNHHRHNTNNTEQTGRRRRRL